jgi:hypothetical protein
MAAVFIKRTLAPVLKRAAAEFPAVVVTGPRQSGKTTLLKALFAKSHRYVSLETPDVRAAAVADPRGFLDLNEPPVIFDEIQHAPDLLSYIKDRIDAERQRRGRYILTGSQNLLVLEQVTESLAGRAAILRLLPISEREVRRRPQAPLPWESGRRNTAVARASPRKLWSSFLRGRYPELVAEPTRGPELWHASYIQTYLERDVRSLRQVGDLAQFQNFLRMLAARSGQLLNLTDIARDLGCALNTAKAWLSILEATFQVFVLRPYFRNVGKRLVRTPKVYFTDVGTLCYLAGLRDPEHAAAGPLAGAIFETAVLGELLKVAAHRGTQPSLYFWRTSTGVEVDFVVETQGKLIPLEAKLSSTPQPGMAAGIAAFQKDYGAAAAPGYVIHPGSVTLPLGAGVTALPYARL